MSRRNPFTSLFLGRAWLETEIDDDGEIVFEIPAVHCPTCHHPLDLGGLDEIDVHRCGYCAKRSRFLWSDRRGQPVQEPRGPNADWGDEKWDDLWRDHWDFDDDHGEEIGLECRNGCEDPVFGGPAEQICLHGRWVCSVCNEQEPVEPDDHFDDAEYD